VTSGASNGSVTPDDVPEYRVARVAEALVHDPRSAELGVAVAFVGGALVLQGNVSTAAHRADIRTVAEEAADGVPVRDELHVVEHEPPDAVEELG
jgi:hypothetical protein